MSIGKVIKHYRKKNGLTQKKLGGTYHSDSHVSDIERGLVFPSHKTLIDFSNVLGVKLTKYLEYVEAQDPIMVEEIVSTAVEYVKNYKYKDANELIQKHKDGDAFFKSYNGQLIVSKYEAIYYAREKGALQEAISILIDSLNLDNQDDYSYVELDILNNIGTFHFMNQEFKDAENSFKRCLSNLEQMTCVEDKRLMSSVFYNLARVNIDLNQYEEVLNYSDKLIEYCIENEYTYMLAKAYYNKGVSEYVLEKREAAIASFRLSYYMFLGLNQHQNAKMMIGYLKEHYQIELI